MSTLGRTLVVDGARWSVVPSGFVTHFARDEHGLLFTRADGTARDVRVVRFSPMGGAGREREAAFRALTDAELVRLFRAAQPGHRSPEAGYQS